MATNTVRLNEKWGSKINIVVLIIL